MQVLDGVAIESPHYDKYKSILNLRELIQEYKKKIFINKVFFKEINMKIYYIYIRIYNSYIVLMSCSLYNI